MKSFVSTCGFLMLFACSVLFAEEPESIAEAKKKFSELVNPTEADRQSYITELANWREALPKKADSEDCFKVDADIRRHPAPADAEGYTRLRLGKWSSPRHEYIYRADGTWSMLPEEDGVTRGRWRIEGNRFMSSADIEPEDTRAYTIILLTKDNFIFTDGETVFYEERISE